MHLRGFKGIFLMMLHLLWIATWYLSSFPKFSLTWITTSKIKAKTIYTWSTCTAFSQSLFSSGISNEYKLFVHHFPVETGIFSINVFTREERWRTWKTNGVKHRTNYTLNPHMLPGVRNWTQAMVKTNGSFQPSLLSAMLKLNFPRYFYQSGLNHWPGVKPSNYQAQCDNNN